jgi:hypothetical protein
VVALDRSSNGPGALRWAVEEAVRRGATVEVVSNRLDLAHVSSWRTDVDHDAAAVADRARTVQREIVRSAVGDAVPTVRMRLLIAEAPLPIAVVLSGAGAELVVIAAAFGLRPAARRRALVRWSRRLECPVVLMPRRGGVVPATAPALSVVPHTA